MRINHNISAMNAQRQLSINQSGNSKALQKLSSGLKINTAADDAAGLAISERMRAQIRGLNQAQSNAQDGISLIQTAEGALQETTELVQRMRELAVQATSDIMTSTDREAIETEMNQLRAEIDRSANTLAYNGKKLFTGEMANIEEKYVTETKLTTSSDIAEADMPVITVADDKKANAAAGTYTFKVDVDSAKLVVTDANGAIYESDKSVGTIATDTLDSLGKVTFSALGLEVDFTGKTGTQDTINSKTVTITSEEVTSRIEQDPYYIGEESLANLQKDFGDVKITVGENASIVGNLKIDYAISEDGDSHMLVLKDSTGKAYYAKDDDGKLAGKLAAIGDEANITAQEIVDAKGKELKTLGKLNFEELGVTIDFTNATAAKNMGEIAGKEFTVGKNPLGARLHVGANADDEGIYLAIADMTIGENGLNMTTESISVTTAENARKTLSKLDEVLTKINTERANLGAMQNRIESTVNNLALSSENLTSAESRIRDVDMAAQMVEYSKYNILNQAAMSMLAQANSQPNMVMNLLQGL